MIVYLYLIEEKKKCICFIRKEIVLIYTVALLYKERKFNYCRLINTFQHLTKEKKMENAK